MVRCCVRLRSPDESSTLVGVVGLFVQHKDHYYRPDWMKYRHSQLSGTSGGATVSSEDRRSASNRSPASCSRSRAGPMASWPQEYVSTCLLSADCFSSGVPAVNAMSTRIPSPQVGHRLSLAIVSVLNLNGTCCPMTCL